MKPAAKVFVEEFRPSIQRTLSRYGVRKQASPEVLRDAIVAFKEPFMVDMYREMDIENYDGLFGNIFNKEKKEEKKASKQQKKDAKKAKKAEKSGSVEENAEKGSWWEKGKGFINDALGIGDAVSGVYAKFKNPQAVIDQEEAEKEADRKKGIYFLVGGVVVVVILVIIVVVVSKKKS